MSNDNKRYLTVNQMSEAYPAFTQSSLRWIIFNKDTNGFSKCVIKIGSKIIIDADAFEQWVDEQRDVK